VRLRLFSAHAKPSGWSGRLIMVVGGTLIVFGLLMLFIRLSNATIDADFSQDYLASQALLISPLTWQHTFMLLFLPFGLLLREMLDRPSWRGAAVSLLALALVSPPNIDIARALIGLYKPDRMPWFAALPLIAPTAGMLLIWWLISAPARAAARRRDCI